MDLSPEAIRRYAMLAQMEGPQPAPSPQAAEKRIGWGPYAALAGGELADILTTLRAKRRGAHEANPLLGNFGPKAIAMKGAMAIPMAVAMRMADTAGHDRLAKWLGYGSGAGLGAVAAHNLTRGGTK